MADARAVRDDVSWRRHSRLLEPRSVIGALAILGIVALSVVGVPFVQHNVDDAARQRQHAQIALLVAADIYGADAPETDAAAGLSDATDTTVQ